MISLRLSALNEYGSGVLDILIGECTPHWVVYSSEASHMAGRRACFEFSHHGVIRTSQIFAYHI